MKINGREFGLLRIELKALLARLGFLIGGSLLFMELKFLFGRPRPEIITHLVYERSLRFPGGHSVVSAVIWNGI